MIDVRLFDNLKRVALAVSGGRDSMALLYDVARQFPRDFFYVINVEHGIRGEESVSDSAFVEDYARSLGVEFKRFDVDAIAYSKEHGYTLEQGARLLRREIFASEVESGRADRVAVAHHLDDNVESVLMHIFRGSGLRGLRGMDADDGMLIRPLLTVSRDRIDDFILEHKIPYRDDSTNSDNAYRRNFLRLDIMPKLRDSYSGVDNAIMRLSTLAREDDDYLNAESERYLKADEDRVCIDTSAPKVLAKRAIYRAFKLLGVDADVEERHYTLLLDLMNMASGTTLDMPYGVRATKEYDAIVLYRESAIDAGEYQLAEGDNVLGAYTMTVELYNGDIVCGRDGEYKVLYVDADKLHNVTYRCRRDGDTFRKFKGGEKKLKDYLIDIKVPRTRRDMPLIVRGDKVLVVAGYEIANDVRIDSDTTRIYKITLRRNAI